MNNFNDLNNYAATSVGYNDQTLGNVTLDDRYTINGLIGTDATVLQNLEKIASAAGSWLSYDISQGKWAVIINKSGTSQYSFDNSNIIGPIKISSTGISDLYNSVKVSFPHEDLRNQTDFVQVTIPSGDRYPNEADKVMELNYGIVTNPVQAQLLGFIELKQSRLDKVITFQTDYSKIGIKAGDLIDVTNTVYGFTNKMFRVITVKEVDDDVGNINIEIMALEYDSSVYDESNLTKYTRSDQNGITTLGNLVAPATPTVTKYEVDARPRVVITTSIPGGVADQIEFWATTDVPPGVQVDSNRTYTLLTSTKPTTGNVFPLNTNVTVEVDNLSGGSFLIKAKALNHEFSSPFSSPSGVLNYAPQQTTDGINTGATVSSNGGSINLASLLEMAALSFAINNGPKVLGNLLGNSGTTLSNTISTFFANTGTVGNIISNVFATGNVSNIGSPGNLTISNPPITAGDGITVTNGVVSINKGATGTLKGEIFPCLFGSNIYAGAYDSRTAVFTHKNIMFGTGNAASAVGASTTAGTKSPTITLTVGSYPDASQKSKTYSRYKWRVTNRTTSNGYYSYNFSANTGSGSTELNPNWTGCAADSDGSVHIYYATCSYDGNVALADQSWSNWTRLIKSNGVTTVVQGATVTEYRVDIEGYTNISCAEGTGGIANAVSGISVPANGIIAFGVSSFAIPDGTPFSGNTIVGAKVTDTVTDYTFPGYTPVSGQTANIQYNLMSDGSVTHDTAAITQSKTILSRFSTEFIDTNAIWPTDFQHPEGAIVNGVSYNFFSTPAKQSGGPIPYPGGIGITGCPTIVVKI